MANVTTTTRESSRVVAVRPVWGATSSGSNEHRWLTPEELVVLRTDVDDALADADAPAESARTTQMTDLRGE